MPTLRPASFVCRWFRCLGAGCLLVGWLTAASHAGAIHDAVLVHDLAGVRQLLLENPDLVNQPTEKGDTPLYIAVFRRYSKQMMPLLLEFGADPNPPPNQRGETPLSIAREINLRQGAELLIRSGAKEDDRSRAAEIRYLTGKRDVTELTARLARHPHLVNARDAFQQTPLMLAVLDERPDDNIIQTLLRLGADPNATNIFGGTPYSAAVEREHVAVIASLRSRGGKETPMSRSAPLRIAAQKGLLQDVQDILQQHPEWAGAHDDLRRTSLHLAGGSSLPIVELLLRHGADVNARDYGDNTPLHAAAAAGKLEIVRALLAKQADARAVNRQRVTPLLNAASSGSVPVVEALLAAGADLKNADNLGETALHRAATSGQVELIKLLLARGFAVDTMDRQRQTPLYQAVRALRSEAVKLLLAHGANPSLVDVTGDSPLRLAERNKREDLVKLLRTPPPAK